MRSAPVCPGRPKSRLLDSPNNVAGNHKFSRWPEIGRFVGGATLKCAPPPVGAISQFPDPVFAGNPAKNTRRRRKKTCRRNPIDPPPREFLRTSRNPGFRISPATSTGTADFRVGPKSENLRAGRLASSGPRRPAQLVNLPTPFSPETLCKTRDGDVRKRADGIR